MKNRRRVLLFLMLAVFAVSAFAYTGRVYADEPKNGWFQDADGYRYYVEDQYLKNTVKKIGTVYYGFGADGLMYSDCVFQAYSEELGVEGYFRAKDGGILYANAWYKDGTKYYYYGAAAAAASGLQVINDTKYIFTEEGIMRVNEICSVDGAYYSVDDKGAAKAMSNNAWSVVTLDGEQNSYYIKNGQLLTGGVFQIGSEFYGFDAKGALYQNRAFSIYDEEEGRDIRYRAQTTGKLYVKKWYRDPDGNRYRYGAEGKAAKGLATISGKKYYFDEDGRLLTDVYIDGTDGAYLANANGIVTVIPNKTWTKVGGKYYYAVGGVGLRSTVRKIGSYYYGFDENGALYDGTAFSIKDEETGDLLNYRAKDGGKLYAGCWYGRYYYGKDGKAMQGKTVIGKKAYFFDEYGCAVTSQFKEINGVFYHADAKGVLKKAPKNGLFYEDANRTEICFLTKGKALRNAWKKVKGSYYYFDKNGYAVRDAKLKLAKKYYLFKADGSMVTKGWAVFHGDTYYVLASGAVATGAKKISGKKYYFGADGKMQTGVVITSKSGSLYAADGHYLGAAKTQGWNKIGGEYYYTEKGKLATGYRTISKQGYYFREDGMMLRNTVLSLPAGVKVFGSNGKEVRSGWCQVGGRWYYVDPDTKCAVTGRKYQVGKQNYYFDEMGRMTFTEMYKDGTLTTFDENGVIKSAKKAADGWTLFGGVYVYMKNGVPFTGWVQEFYVKDGRMLRNSDTPDGYYVQQNGAKQKKAGWVTRTSVSGKYQTGQYVKKGGKLAKDEWVKISGKQYYFEGYTRKTGVSRIGKVWYIFNETGAMVKKLGKKLPEGWVKAGTSKYYFKNDRLISGSLEIKGKIYSFLDSRMLTEGFAYTGDDSSSYFNNKNGQASSYHGWKKIGGRWFYFGADARGARGGWVRVGGKQFYIDENGMATGYRLIDGKLYYFDKSGAMTKRITLGTGWKKLGKKKYYFKNGVPVAGDVVTVKGKTYVFDYDGTLAINKSVGEYFGAADGQVVRRAWRKIGNVYRYYGAEGTRLSGVWKIGGKVYYLDE